MKKIIQFIKPRMIFVNLIAVLGGFFFAIQGKINFTLLFFVLFGSTCIIASGCIFNNIIDIDIDKKMFRTKDRLLIHEKHLIIYAKVVGYLLFLISIFIFFEKVNLLSMLLAVSGFIYYVIIYTIYMKRISIYDIIIGSIAGAMPPLIGYCSVTNIIDYKAILLFFLYFVWQVPHSYTILIIYNKDYQAAKIPTIVLQKGKSNTLKNICYYILIFTILSTLLYILNYVHMICFIPIFLTSIFWLLISLIHYFLLNNFFLLKLLFYWSIIIIFVINFIFIINYMLL